ncbi:hypothetical protein C1I99_07125 [Micromonospora deserti]|uniref:Uncharacterized protein n=1 Tax=Micromonospora deserti TaxID=2070366 RepID=A0A2W2DW46_9ACTN|nr:hypothetical protein C1I99_07125 [Micromonospora deserti]
MVGWFAPPAPRKPRAAGPHDRIVFAANPAGELVRGGWLPEPGQVAPAVGELPAPVGDATRRRLR